MENLSDNRIVMEIGGESEKNMTKLNEKEEKPQGAKPNASTKVGRRQIQNEIAKVKRITKVIQVFQK